MSDKVNLNEGDSVTEVDIMARFDLSDTQFSLIEPLLPPEHSGQQGHPYSQHRRVLNGILWVLRTGAPWRDLPERYGPFQTCHDRLTRWQKDGTWGRLLAALQTDPTRADAEGDVFVDSTIVKAHPHAAGARLRTAKPLRRRGRVDECVPCEGEALGRSRGGLTTKVHLACDGQGRPVSTVRAARCHWC